MAEIADRIASLRKITPEQLERELLVIIRDHEQVIVQMNTDQLYAGKRADGEQMPNYSPVSVTVYGKPDGPIRLFDQGDFYKGFFIDADKFPVLLGSKDRKTLMLVEGNQFRPGYGEQIFGVDKANQASLNKDYLLDAIRNMYRQLV
jgi:hypothetical protein